MSTVGAAASSAAAYMNLLLYKYMYVMLYYTIDVHVLLCMPKRNKTPL